MAPGTRVPLAKMMVGVPVMRAFLPKLEVARHGSRVASRRGRGHVAHHPVDEGLALVLGAPDVARLLARVGAQDWVQEHVHRHVVDLHQVALEALAVAAVGVLEHRQLALAIAAHDGEGVFQRQVLEGDGGELVHALLGQVHAGLGVDHRTLDQVVAFGVGVEQLALVDAHLVDARHGRLADLVDGRQVGQALGEVLADGGFLGDGGHRQGSQGRDQEDLKSFIVGALEGVRDSKEGFRSAAGPWPGGRSSA